MPGRPPGTEPIEGINRSWTGQTLKPENEELTGSIENTIQDTSSASQPLAPIKEASSPPVSPKPTETARPESPKQTPLSQNSEPKEPTSPFVSPPLSSNPKDSASNEFSTQDGFTPVKSKQRKPFKKNGPAQAPLVNPRTGKPYKRDEYSETEEKQRIFNAGFKKGRKIPPHERQADYLAGVDAGAYQTHLERNVSDSYTRPMDFNAGVIYASMNRDTEIANAREWGIQEGLRRRGVLDQPTISNRVIEISETQPVPRKEFPAPVVSSTMPSAVHPTSPSGTTDSALRASVRSTEETKLQRTPTSSKSPRRGPKSSKPSQE